MDHTGTLPADWKQGSCFNELGEPGDFEREYFCEYVFDTYFPSDNDYDYNSREQKAAVWNC